MRRSTANGPAAQPTGSGREALGEAARLLVILWASFPAIRPLLARGLPLTHDGLGHLLRLLDFDLTFRAGEIYPRLAPHLALDYGYATFTFYSPGGVYLDETFRLFGLGYIAAWKAGLAASILASALGAYLLARDLYGWRGGMVASLVYVYVPYHLLDVYARGDVAECLALALFPFVAWSFWRVGRCPRPGRVVAAGVCLAALVVAHSLSALLAVPLALGFFVLGCGWRDLVRRLGAAVFAGLLGLALSAFYWVPVVAQAGLVKIDAVTTAFDYHHRFLPLAHLVQAGWVYDYNFVLQSDSIFNLGRAQVALVALAVTWVALTNPRQRALALGCAAGIASLLWLEQAGSTFVWDLLPLARLVQFPFRMSALVAVLSAVAIGAAASRPPSLPGRARRVSLAIIGPTLGVVALGVLAVTSLPGLPSAPSPIGEDQVSLPMMWRLEADEGALEANTPGEFLPRLVRGDFFADASAWPPQAAPVTPVRLTTLAAGPLSLEARVVADRPGQLVFDWLDYPAWRATLDGAPLRIDPSGPLGLVGVTVPAGTHLLDLSATDTIFDRVGLIVSALGLIAAGTFALRARRSMPVPTLAVAGLLLLGGVVGVRSQLQPALPLAGGVDFVRNGVPMIRLVGSQLNRASRTPAGAADLTLTWEALTAPLPDCTVYLTVLDPAGRVLTSGGRTPLYGLRPCSTWQAGEVVRDEEQVRLPAGVAPGAYQVALGLSLGNDLLMPDAGVQPTVQWSDSELPSDQTATGIVLGGLPIGAARPVQAPAEATPTGDSFANRIILDAERVSAIDAWGQAMPPGADRRFVARAVPGGSLSLELFWRSRSAVSADYAVFTQLLNGKRGLAAQDDAAPDRFYFPTSAWLPDDTRDDRYQLPISRTTRPGLYTLVAGLYDPASLKRLLLTRSHDGQDQIVLGTVKVSGPGQVFGAPVPLDRRDDVLGGQIALVGAAVRPEVRTLAVDLAWRAVETPRANYTVFVHLMSPTGRLIAQLDGPPLDGAYPTSAWDVGDTVYDHVVLSLPTLSPEGSDQVVVGLYQLENGQRLTTSDGRDSIPIGAIKVRGT